MNPAILERVQSHSWPLLPARSVAISPRQNAPARNRARLPARSVAVPLAFPSFPRGGARLPPLAAACSVDASIGLFVQRFPRPLATAKTLAVWTRP